MGNVIRPVFTNGERLTAQRLNELVEYLRTSLRRALLAPLSPGVAAGLELAGSPPVAAPAIQQPGTPSPPAAATATQSYPAVTVSPGVGIDGVARILLSTQTLSFTYHDIKAQVQDLAADDQILVSLGVSCGTASPVPAACAPTTGGSVSEGVQLIFTRPEVMPDYARTPFEPVLPWADPIDQGGTAASYAVPLGSVVCLNETALIPSPAQRAGVMPWVGGLRNSYGDPPSLLLNEINGISAMAVTVPTVFEETAPAFFRTCAGGPYVQAAVVATDLGWPPAGRPSAADPTVFEAAGGNAGLAVSGASPGLATLPGGTSGVVAISMEYDVATGILPVYGTTGFHRVPHSGFPLVLSPNAQTQPKVAPPALPAPGPYIGLSAAASHPDATGTLEIVPVATSGIVCAYVFVPASTTTPIPVGTLLSPSLTPMEGRWGLVQVSGRASGHVVVAQLATPVSSPSSSSLGTWQPAFVWVVPPYNAPTTPGTVVAAGIVGVRTLDKDTVEYPELARHGQALDDKDKDKAAYAPAPYAFGGLRVYNYDPGSREEASKDKPEVVDLAVARVNPNDGRIWVLFDDYRDPRGSRSFTYVVKAMVVKPLIDRSPAPLPFSMSVTFDAFHGDKSGITLTVMAAPATGAPVLVKTSDLGISYFEIEVTRYPN